jgi:DNA-binding GntR family transcriptional regulator
MSELISGDSPLAFRDSFGSLVADVYERIYGQLMAVAIEPGQRLSVDALAREFDVSQTPIRAALSRLESDGLVVKHHLRGYRATPALTRDELGQLFDLRIMLETYSSGHAAELRTEEHLAELERLDAAMARCDRNAADGSGYAEFTVLDRRMHGVIAAACGNDLVQAALLRLHSHLHVYRTRRTVVDQAIEEHGLILNAIRRRDPYLARGSMQSHLEHARARAMVGLAGAEPAGTSPEDPVPPLEAVDSVE